MRIKHIKQKSDWDCAITSISMFTGLPYSTVLKNYRKISSNSDGLSETQIFRLFDILNVSVKTINCLDPDLNILKKIYNSKKVLMVDVVSLNEEEGLHTVVWDGKYLLDPNYKVSKKKYYKKNYIPIKETIRIYWIDC